MKIFFLSLLTILIASLPLSSKELKGDLANYWPWVCPDFDKKDYQDFDENDKTDDNNNEDKLIQNDDEDE